MTPLLNSKFVYNLSLVQQSKVFAFEMFWGKCDWKDRDKYWLNFYLKYDLVFST